MRTDSQARAARRATAIHRIAILVGIDNLWDAYDALLDLGVTIDEIEGAILENRES